MHRHTCLACVYMRDSVGAYALIGLGFNYVCVLFTCTCVVFAEIRRYCQIGAVPPQCSEQNALDTGKTWPGGTSSRSTDGM